jgi:sulfonate transport system substrate-binding protein
MSSTRNRPRLAAVVLLLVLALVVAACGDDSDSETSSTTAAPAGDDAASSTTTAGSAEPTYEEITIKLLNPGNHGYFAYAKKSGLLEEELAKVNAKVEWVDGPGAFSANLDAMKAGNITAAQAAVSPVVGALIAGLDFRIFAIAPPSEAKSAGIVARADSGIESIEDLVGKKVAVNPAAHGEYILLKALEEAGVPFDEVERVPIQPPDAAAAFASGSVDAWATFNTFFTGALANGATLLAYEADLESDDTGIISASVEQLERNPAAFKVIVDVYNQLVEEGHTEPEKFQNVIDQSGPTAVSGAQLEQQIEDTRVTPLIELASPEGIARVQGVLDIFAEAGVLQKTVPVDDVVFDIDAAIEGK